MKYRELKKILVVANLVTLSGSQIVQASESTNQKATEKVYSGTENNLSDQSPRPETDAAMDEDDWIDGAISEGDLADKTKGNEREEDENNKADFGDDLADESLEKDFAADKEDETNKEAILGNDTTGESTEEAVVKDDIIDEIYTEEILEDETAGDDAGLRDETGEDTGLEDKASGDAGKENETAKDAGLEGEASGDGRLEEEAAGDVGVEEASGDVGVEEASGGAGLEEEASKGAGLEEETAGDIGVEDKGAENAAELADEITGEQMMEAETTEESPLEVNTTEKLKDEEIKNEEPKEEIAVSSSMEPTKEDEEQEVVVYDTHGKVVSRNQYRKGQDYTMDSFLSEISQDGLYTVCIQEQDVYGHPTERKYAVTVNQSGTSFRYDKQKANVRVKERFTPAVAFSNLDEITILSCMVNGKPAVYQIKDGLLQVADEQISRGKNRITLEVKDGSGNISSMTPWEFYVEDSQNDAVNLNASVGSQASSFWKRVFQSFTWQISQWLSGLQGKNFTPKK